MLHLREAWATVPLDRKNKTPIRGMAPANHRKSTMTITETQLKEIRQEFAKLKPATITLDGNRAMTVKQAIFTLAPTLERMKKRGFDLTEARRQKEGRKTQKRDTPPPPPRHEQRGSFIVADIPDDEL